LIREVVSPALSRRSGKKIIVLMRGDGEWAHLIINSETGRKDKPELERETSRSFGSQAEIINLSLIHTSVLSSNYQVKFIFERR
jgi:hypothetical protein